VKIKSKDSSFNSTFSGPHAREMSYFFSGLGIFPHKSRLSRLDEAMMNVQARIQLNAIELN